MFIIEKLLRRKFFNIFIQNFYGVLSTNVVMPIQLRREQEWKHGILNVAHLYHKLRANFYYSLLSNQRVKKER